MKKKSLLKISLIVILSLSSMYSSSIEKATFLNEQGLISEAKKEYIDIIFSKMSDNDKAESYYKLGTMDFNENRIGVALDLWKELSNKFPNSTQAKIVKERINELSQIVGENSKEITENAIASSYLRSADFWSKGKKEIFMIDSSWLQNIEASIKWYDKVIKEYPKTTASKIAYKDKMRAIIGWREIGRNGEAYGIEKSFSKYMPLLLDTFNKFSEEFPNDSSLQVFRYQIAQAYWSSRDWDKTREWLNIIIKESGENDGFYKDLALRRLEKVEY